ncbi:hypothetical protein [Viridibacillus arvi]|uniref:hypothetical protein n=1 Tax=Viridibacillus arvi TaxID=263475 RepID=UPI0034CFCAEC
MKPPYYSLLLIPLCLAFSQFAQADESRPVKESKLDEIVKEEGQVVYEVHYDYDAICNLLKLTQKEYDIYWEKGLSIADMANKQGIERAELEEYFVTFHRKEMEKWRAKGLLTERLYFTQVYMLKNDIDDFIDRNPNE